MLLQTDFASRVPLSPALFLAGASNMIGMREHRDRPRISASDTAFIHHVGYWSHYNYSIGWSAWPLEAAEDANELARIAEEKRILSSERPQAGELFLLWCPTSERFVQSGIVAFVRAQSIHIDGSTYFECTTIEGNTNEAGRLNAGGVHRTTRTLSPERGDRFVRWVDLDGRGSSCDQAAPLEGCAARMMRQREAA